MLMMVRQNLDDHPFLALLATTTPVFEHVLQSLFETKDPFDFLFR